MKKKLFLIGLLISYMCLASCKESTFSYGDKVDLSKEYILYHNVDYKNGTFLRYTNSDKVIDAVRNGEDVLLLYTSDSCNTCKEIMPDLLNDLSYLRLNIFTINENTSGNARKINEYIAESGIKKVISTVMSGGTPSMYLLNKSALTEIFYGSKGEKTFDVVINSLKKYTSCSGIDYCVEEYEEADADAITYILDKNDESSTDFYYEKIYPLAKKTMKVLQVLDVTSTDDTKKLSILESFGYADDSRWNLDSFSGWLIDKNSSLLLRYDDESITSFLENNY